MRSLRFCGFPHVLYVIFLKLLSHTRLDFHQSPNALQKQIPALPNSECSFFNSTKDVVTALQLFRVTLSDITFRIPYDFVIPTSQPWPHHLHNKLLGITIHEIIMGTSSLTLSTSEQNELSKMGIKISKRDYEFELFIVAYKEFQKRFDLNHSSCSTLSILNSSVVPIIHNSTRYLSTPVAVIPHSQHYGATVPTGFVVPAHSDWPQEVRKCDEHKLLQKFSNQIQLLVFALCRHDVSY